MIFSSTRPAVVPSVIVLAALLVLQGCASRWDSYKQVQAVQGEYKGAWADRADRYEKVLGIAKPDKKGSGSASAAIGVSGVSGPSGVSGAERIYYEAALSELTAFADFRKSGIVLSSARSWILERRKARLNTLRSMDFSDDDLKKLLAAATSFEVAGIPDDRVAAFAREFGRISELDRLFLDLVRYHLEYRAAFRKDRATVPPATPPMSSSMMNAIISGAQAGARIGSGIK